MTQNKMPVAGNYSREGSLKVAENGQEVELSFSSTEPYRRYYGYEVLSHDEGAVDLSRLNEIGVLLFNHDRDKVIGKIKKAWIEDQRGKALVEFDHDEKSMCIFEKVQSGTLKGVSVGYSVTEWERQDAPGDEDTGDDETWIAKKWTPFEVSIVSIPADPTVGVGRSMEQPPEVPHGTYEEKTENNAAIFEKSATIEKNQTPKEISNMENLNEKASAAPQIDERALIEGERSRIETITSMCRDFDINPDEFIKNGASVDNARAAIMDQLKARKAPVATVTRDETDNFRAAAVDSLVMRAGGHVDNAAKGSQELRGFNLRDLAIEALARDPQESRSADQLRRMTPDQLFNEVQRSYFSPTALFPSILDAAIKKNIVEIYQKAPTTFEAWTSKGSVSDFKATPEHNYIVGGGSFEKVAENGELKQSRPSDELLPTRKIDTYGAQFTMTRQAFVNDDIGFLSKVPGIYAAAAKRKINRQCYELLFNNDKIYDGKTLFHADHGNLVTTGAAPSLAAINALMLKLQAQKDPFGEALNITPRTLILPVGYGFEIDTLLHSASITTSEINNTGYNPLANKGLTYVEDATLNALAGTNACPWFLVADALSAKSIQVDYLNGNEAPTIRRAERPGQLGIVWDIYLDWGITAIDFRGIAKNAGAKISL